MKDTAKDRLQLIASMIIFGTIGVLRRAIPYPSSVIALARGAVGTLFLLILHFCRHQKFPRRELKANLPLLCTSGVLLGLNWILLFEAYRYTSVSAATVCYYMAPVLVILASPVLFHEALTLKKGLCALAAVIGMVLVSGVAESGISGGTGILFALGAAVLYACIVILNKFIRGLSADDRTVIQLGIAAAALLPYVLLSEKVNELAVTPQILALLAVAGILHTGIAYILYFGSIRSLPAQTSALLSYLDPVTAVLLSVFVLKEPLTLFEAAGAVIVIGAAVISETNPGSEKRG